MKTRKHPVNALSDGSQVGTFFTGFISGYLESIEYIKDGTTPFTDGVDFTITAEATGETLWTDTNINASEVVRPRAATHSTAGVAALYAAGGVAVLDKIALGRDRVKIVLAQAGVAKLGRFVVTTSDY